jgi:hypothetical protein
MMPSSLVERIDSRRLKSPLTALSSEERLVERTVHAMDVVWSGRGPRTH